MGAPYKSVPEDARTVLYGCRFQYSPHGRRSSCPPPTAPATAPCSSRAPCGCSPLRASASTSATPRPPPRAYRPARPQRRWARSFRRARRPRRRHPPPHPVPANPLFSRSSLIPPHTSARRTALLLTVVSVALAASACATSGSPDADTIATATRIASPTPTAEPALTKHEALAQIAHYSKINNQANADRNRALLDTVEEGPLYAMSVSDYTETEGHDLEAVMY
ncbi:hypothetical protein ACIBLA_30330 [Streptomyces sp. NPDC050433]|uniref:hypothetical protein n=1 Tax=Streptomyces sp. NPDC050433 TaxID=3365615 RepID=UPI0037BB2271